MSIENTATTAITMGSPSNLNNLFNGGGSVGGWINWNSTSAAYIARKGSTGNGWDIRTGTGFTLGFFRHRVASGNVGFWLGDDSMTTGLNHVMVTHADLDDPLLDPVLYVNKRVQSLTEVQTPTDIVDSDAGQRFSIGNAYGDTAGIDGEMTDWRAWNRPITADEVTELFIGRGADSVFGGLIGYWPMMELADGASVASGGVVDISGSGNNGSPISTPVYRDNDFFRRR